jgi:hypothetical protein
MACVSCRYFARVRVSVASESFFPTVQGCLLCLST